MNFLDSKNKIALKINKFRFFTFSTFFLRLLFWSYHTSHAWAPTKIQLCKLTYKTICSLAIAQHKSARVYYRETNTLLKKNTDKIKQLKKFLFVSVIMFILFTINTQEILNSSSVWSYPSPGQNVRTGDFLEGRISESEQ